MKQDYIIGTFVREEKNRFLCTVNVEGKDEECYIPSSCRLENFLELAGKEVLLKANQSKDARTRLMVYALQFKQNYIVLRTSEANSVILDSIHSRRFSFLGKRDSVLREKKIEGYKADLYISDTKTIIEVKSIISIDNNGIFPTVYSERAIIQMKTLSGLIEQGYRVVYIFVALNPYTQKINISRDSRMKEYYEEFIKCRNQGMICKAYCVNLNKNINSLCLKREIIVE